MPAHHKGMVSCDGRGGTTTNTPEHAIEGVSSREGVLVAGHSKPTAAAVPASQAAKQKAMTAAPAQQPAKVTLANEDADRHIHETLEAS